MRQLVRAKSHRMSWLLDVGIASRDICPMAELVTASDCYLTLGKVHRKVVSSSLTGAVHFCKFFLFSSL